mmetsp:Transcript_32286/g.62360  ORF Transcript_32286/g.62360 Transcript_32286/m.62360 type:complete len:223 (+) Transcript_32286:1824-2492(+)
MSWIIPSSLHCCLIKLPWEPRGMFDAKVTKQDTWNSHFVMSAAESISRHAKKLLKNLITTMVSLGSASMRRGSILTIASTSEALALMCPLVRYLSNLSKCWPVTADSGELGGSIDTGTFSSPPFPESLEENNGGAAFSLFFCFLDFRSLAFPSVKPAAENIIANISNRLVAMSSVTLESNAIVIFCSIMDIAFGDFMESRYFRIDFSLQQYSSIWISFAARL